MFRKTRRKYGGVLLWFLTLTLFSGTWTQVKIKKMIGMCVRCFYSSQVRKAQTYRSQCVFLQQDVHVTLFLTLTSSLLMHNKSFCAHLKLYVTSLSIFDKQYAFCHGLWNAGSIILNLQGFAFCQIQYLSRNTWICHICEIFYYVFLTCGTIFLAYYIPFMQTPNVNKINYLDMDVYQRHQSIEDVVTIF